MKLQKKNFTLVEIMIVVAIIGLLAAIAIPSFLRARENAQTNACINNLRQIDSAIQQWAINENKASDATVTTTEIDDYIDGTVDDLACPGGGSNFADSYTIQDAETTPVCQIDNVNHVLD